MALQTLDPLPSVEAQQHRRVILARRNLILDAPFYGSLLMRLALTPAPVPTFRTNGESLWYNPEYAAKCTDGQLRYILAHEVAHCVQGHLWRMGHRRPEQWNHACDYTINEMLEQYVEEERHAWNASNPGRTYISPWDTPPDVLLNPNFRGLSAEAIYKILTQQEDQNSNDPYGKDSKSNESPAENGNETQDPRDESQDPSGNPAPNGKSSKPGNAPANGNSQPDPFAQLGAADPTPGEFIAPPPKEPGTQESNETDWHVAAVQAAHMAKMRGDCPGCIRSLLEKILAPKVPWNERLREFMRSPARDDYSWRTPNRRYTGSGLYLPSMRSEKIGSLVIVTDSSGSTQRYLEQFTAEVQSALDDVQPETLHVLYCDASVHDHDEFRPGDTVRMDIPGGGGTAFAPAFQYIAERFDAPPVAIVYLTDGDGDNHSQKLKDSEPDCPVLWVTTRRTDFPFGEILKIED